MSWILGYAGATVPAGLPDRLDSMTPDPLVRTQTATQVVRAGGLANTCRFFSSRAEEQALIVGLGMQRTGSRSRPMDDAAWTTVLAAPAPRLEGLDGHFVVLRWSGPRWEAWTDPLGVRTLYLAPWRDGIVYSTRLDWLGRCTHRHALDLDAFGGHWLTFNQLTTDALIQDVERLGPNGHAQWNADDGLRRTETPWTPPFSDGDDGSSFEAALNAFVHPELPADARLSLGLSGGLDSRLLLSMLPEQGAQVHAFGDASHPDVTISRRIASDLGVPHRHLHEPVPDADACLELLRAHVARTQVVSPASAVLGLRHYPALHADDNWVIDGGFGEVARRQFMNRLLRRGRTALKHLDADGVLPHLRVSRADVFDDGVLQAMQQGAARQLERQWATMPSPDDIGLENHVDLLGVRTRLPNFFGYEQNRLDGLARCYMPLAQPSVVRAVFQLPVRDRRGGRLVRRLIREHQPALTRYPLVKGATTYPFRLTPALAYLWTHAKARFQPAPPDVQRRTFLDRLRPFALDAVDATDVRTFALYDRDKLRRLVRGYYRDGDSESAAAVDWWLAFEVWRRCLTR